MSSPPTTGAPTVPFNNSLLGSDSSTDNEITEIVPTGASVYACHGECASLYKDTFNSKKLLMVMAYGIIASGRNIGDYQADPYASCGRRNAFLPMVPMLIKEVFRRCASKKTTAPKCKNWPKPMLLEWLIKNPTENLPDVNFLIKEEESFRSIIIDAEKERANGMLTATESTKKKSPWVSNEPFLRLYHCLLDDNVKKAFQKKDDSLNRQQLDGNKSDKRLATYAELARDLFNDPKFRPVSEDLPDLHEDFGNKIALELETMPGIITADEVKTRLADSRAKLVIVSSHVCTNNPVSSCLTLFSFKMKDH
jgi:hypothetical protein